MDIENNDLLDCLTIRTPENNNPIRFSNISPMDFNFAEILRRNLTNREIKVGHPPEAKRLEKEIRGKSMQEEQDSAEVTTLEDIFKSSWVVYNPPSRYSKWQLTNSSSLIQTNNTGSYVKGQEKNFGTIAISNYRLERDGASINAKIKIGSDGESGLVFNFIDGKNYCVLRYRHNDKWPPVDAIAVYHIHDGISQLKADEVPSEINLANSEVNFAIIQQANDVLLKVYSFTQEWPIVIPNVKLSKGLGLGVYSRYCTDAEYLNLTVSELPSSSVASSEKILLPQDIHREPEKEYEKTYSLQEVDLRSLGWLQQIQRLFSEVVFSNKRFSIAESRYEDETSKEDISPEALNNIESYYRNAFNKKLDCDRKYSEFKGFLASEGIQVDDPKDVGVNILGKSEINLKKNVTIKNIKTWRSFYIQYDIYFYRGGRRHLINSYRNRVRHSTYIRTDYGVYNQTGARGGSIVSFVTKKWYETNFVEDYETKVVEVNNTIDIFSDLKDFIKNKEHQASDVLDDVAKSSFSADIREYSYQSGEYIDQYGETLQDHVIKITEEPDPNREDIIILKEIDQLDSDAGPSKLLLVKNPTFSGKQIHPPTFLFEEDYMLDVGWSGIGLGEFSHSINLFPGEEREMKVVTTRKRSWETVRKTSQKQKTESKTETTDNTKRNDSFEEKLNNSFENSSKFDSSSEKTSSYDVSGEVSANWGWGNAKVKAGKKGSSTSKANSSLSSVQKNVNDTCKKASAEVSRNNKVSFGSTSELETNLEEKMTGEDMESETTTIKISNINEGKTLNFNFFQITNIYNTKLKIEDVKIHVSTGIEIIPGTGITVSKSYDIEDYANIMQDLRMYSVDDRREIVKAISAQIMQRYLHIKADSVDDDPLLLQADDGLSHYQMRILRNKCAKILYQPDVFEVADNDEILQEALNQEPVSSADTRTETAATEPPAVAAQPEIFDEIDTFKQRFPEQLYEFSQSRFKVMALEVGDGEYYTINSGKYYVDSEVGLKPATEDYLELRRQIETERQQALVEDLKERIKAGVFIREYPVGLASLSINSDTKEQQEAAKITSVDEVQ